METGTDKFGTNELIFKNPDEDDDEDDDGPVTVWVVVGIICVTTIGVSGVTVEDVDEVDSLSLAFLPRLIPSLLRWEAP